MQVRKQQLEMDMELSCECMFLGHNPWVLDKEKRVEEHVGERERRGVGAGRERVHVRRRERERQRFGSSFYVFSSTWACPMQIGLIQECCLFYLKSSLWSADLPCFYLATAILDSFSLFYLTFPPQEMGGPILWE